MKIVTAILSLESSFFSASSVIFAGSFVVNVLNYIFTLVMGRLLSVEDFGEVAPLLSLFIIISVPATALARLMARESAHYKEQGDSGVRSLFIRMRAYSAAGAVGLWALFIFLVPFVSDYLRIPTLPIYIFSAVAPLAILGALQSGTLQGLQKFFSVAKQGILSALVKLGGSVLLVWAGFSVAGVMGALGLASLASFIYGVFATRSHLRGVAPESGQAFNISGLAPYFGRSSACARRGRRARCLVALSDECRRRLVRGLHRLLALSAPRRLASLWRTLRRHRRVPRDLYDRNGVHRALQRLHQLFRGHSQHFLCIPSGSWHRGRNRAHRALP